VSETNTVMMRDKRVTRS